MFEANKSLRNSCYAQIFRFVHSSLHVSVNFLFPYLKWGPKKTLLYVQRTILHHVLHEEMRLSFSYHCNLSGLCGSCCFLLLRPVRGRDRFPRLQSNIETVREISRWNHTSRMDFLDVDSRVRLAVALAVLFADLDVPLERPRSPNAVFLRLHPARVRLHARLGIVMGRRSHQYRSGINRWYGCFPVCSPWYRLLSSIYSARWNEKLSNRRLDSGRSARLERSGSVCILGALQRLPRRCNRSQVYGWSRRWNHLYHSPCRLCSYSLFLVLFGQLCILAVHSFYFHSLRTHDRWLHGNPYGKVEWGQEKFDF